jgi:hypothetical protein
MTSQIPSIAKGLTKRPRMTLLAWPSGQWSWMQAVEAVKAQGERGAAYRHTIRPLEVRGLAVLAFGGFYNPETGVWKPKRYRLTDLGRRVKDHLQSGEDRAGDDTPGPFADRVEEGKSG